MPVIRCQACGKPNPDFLEVCQYCDARLVPVTAGAPSEAPSEPAGTEAQNGVIRCQACGKPNPADLDICQFCEARLKPLAAPLSPERLTAAAPEPASEAEEVGQAEELPQAEEEADWLSSLRGAEAIEAEPTAAAPEAPAEAAPDWLSSLRGLDAVAGEQTGEEEIPDWLRSADVAGAEAEAAPTPAEDIPDWLRSMGASAEAEAEAEEAAPGAEQVPDWLSSLRGAEVEEPEATPAAAEQIPDWLRAGAPAEPARPSAPLAEEREPAAAEPAPAQPSAIASEEPAEEVPDWLRALGVTEPFPAEAPTAAAEPPSAPRPAESEPDWLRALRTPTAPLAEEAAAEPAPPAEEPDWLASLRETAPQPSKPGTAPFVTTHEAAPPEPPAEEVPEAAETPAAELPDWLASMRPSADTPLPPATPTPAARPAVFADDEAASGLAQAALPSWLQALRPVEVEQPTITPEVDTYEETVGVLAGMRGVLRAEPAVALPHQTTTRVHALDVSEAEAAQVDLLQTLVSQEAQARPAGPRRAQLALPLERWLISLALGLAIVVPFFLAPGLFALPTRMARETRDAFELIESLPTDRAALVTFDYEPAQTGELNPIAEAMVGHLMRRGIPVVGVSIRPAGAAIGDQVLKHLATSLSEDFGLTYSYGVHFLNLGYIPGGPVGVLQFASNPRSMFSTDFGGEWTAWGEQGAPLLSGVGRLDDFGLVLLITATPDSARAWIEQTRSFAGSVPMLAALSAGAEPMVRPYYEVDPGAANRPQVAGLVSGIIGAAQYEQSAGVAGAAGARWDAVGGGLLAAAVLVAVGNVVNGLLAVLRRRKG